MTATRIRYLDRHGRPVDLEFQIRARVEIKKLALRIVDIGFKVLSKELHPDKGGQHDAMARLNRAREILKAGAGLTYDPPTMR